MLLANRVKELGKTKTFLLYRVGMDKHLSYKSGGLAQIRIHHNM